MGTSIDPTERVICMLEAAWDRPVVLGEQRPAAQRRAVVHTVKTLALKAGHGSDLAPIEALESVVPSWLEAHGLRDEAAGLAKVIAMGRNRVEAKRRAHGG